MVGRLLLPLLLPVLAWACQEGWTEHGGACYRLLTHEETSLEAVEEYRLVCQVKQALRLGFGLLVVSQE